MYLNLLTDEFRAAAAKRENNRVYNTPAVILLMVMQRLHKDGGLHSAVLELPGLPASLWPNPCKRLLPGGGELSDETGAFSKARQRLPLTAVEQLCDHAFERFTALNEGAVPVIGRRAFIFDGTTLRMQHTEALLKLYPPTTNQEAESHWTLAKMLVAHDLATGLGMRPVWGAVNGPNAVSEQRLFELAVELLPELAVMVADANFGVFSVAYASIQRNHPVVVRMTKQRASSMLLHATLRDGIDRPHTWKPTKADRKSHPELPADACIRGRLIVAQVQPSNGGPLQLLCLFTTLEDAVDEIVKLYGQRWHIETDIRHLKGELRLAHLISKTPQMVHKEIEIALLSFNLVRAAICQAAQQTGVDPRRFSFTKVKRLLNFYGPKIIQAKTEEDAAILMDRMSRQISNARLPNRRKKRETYPRAIWHSAKPFPSRKAKS